MFNRKSTELQQDIHRLEVRLNSLEHKQDTEKSRNDRNLLEYAELGEKMRRLYLRIARRSKIEEEQTSEPEGAENGQSPRSEREIRDEIEKRFLGG